MKTHLTANCLLVVLFTLLSAPGRAQTVLSAGDIAVIGFNSSFNTSGAAPIGPDGFAIVTLTDIGPGTNIRITDHGWAGFGMLNGTVQDGIMSWTTTSVIPKGTVFSFTVTMSATPSLTISPNTYGTPVIIARWTSGATAGAFNNSGDQVIIYQGGTDDNPGTFIYGFNSSSSTAAAAGNWQPSAGGFVDSQLPPGLTNNPALDGTVAATAIAFTNNGVGGYFANNFVYTGIKAGSKDVLLKAIANRSNWTYTTTLTTTYDLTVGGANFPGPNPVFSMVTLPVHIINFSGAKTAAGQLLEWKTTNEENFSHYEIEKSGDGRVFFTIGNVDADRSGQYSFMATGAVSRNYYRLKLVDIDDHFIYSNTILLQGQQEPETLQIYPNPVTDAVTISSHYNIKEIKVVSLVGETLLSIKGKSFNAESISLASLPTGVYVLQVITDNGMEARRLLKK